MPDNTLPRRLTLPPLDTPILHWWARDWDRACFVLSPFFHVPGAHPRTHRYGPTYSDSTVSDFLDNLDTMLTAPASPNEAPDDFDDRIKQTGHPVRWDRIMADLNITDFKTFARSLWLTKVHAARKDIDTDMMQSVTAHCDAQALYLPEEDVLPAILEPCLFDWFTALGLSHVKIDSEFHEAPTDSPIEAFSKDQESIFLKAPQARFKSISHIWSDDIPFYLSFGHDDIWGLLALSETAYQTARPERFLETVTTSPADFIDWLNPVSFFPRKTTRPT